jgi:hypothetical protein
MATPKAIFFGKVDKNGILKITDRAGLASSLNDFIEQEVRLTIEKAGKRPLNKNAFYWGNFIQSQIDCFKERFGETYRKEQIHDWNKTNFWGTEILVEETGEVLKMPGSSTVYTGPEFDERLENIRSWFLQNFDWPLPYPEKQSTINY